MNFYKSLSKCTGRSLYLSQVSIYIIFILFLSSISLNATEYIKILIKTSKSKISFEATDFIIKDERVGDRLFSIKKKRDITVSIKSKDNQDGIIVMGKFFPTTGIIVESKNRFKIDNKRLKFKLLVTTYNKKLYAINLLPIESYLAGIIHTEISPSWPEEAIKAQVVVSRTYALRKKFRNLFRPYDLETTVLDQVYKGMGMVNSHSTRMVAQTYGEVIAYKHELIEAFFHSNSGGMTQDGTYFSGVEVPYLKPTNDIKYLKGAPKTNWKYKLPLKKFSYYLRRANLISGSFKKIIIVKRSKSGRVLKLTLVSKKRKTISGEKLRAILGYGKLLSTKFSIKINKKYIVINGKGFGHGVGMSQWGAFGMAKVKKTYKEIIHKYFTNVKIVKMY